MTFPRWSSGSPGGKSVIEDAHMQRGVRERVGDPRVAPVGGSSEGTLEGCRALDLRGLRITALIPHGICLCGASGA